MFPQLLRSTYMLEQRGIGQLQSLCMKTLRLALFYEDLSLTICLPLRCFPDSKVDYIDMIYVVIFVSYIHVYFLHNSVIYCSNAQSNTMVLVHSEEEDAEEKEDII